MASYYVISLTDDGAYVTEYKTAEKLQEAITPNEFGESSFGDGPLTFLTELPSSLTDYSERGELIIKGEIVVPKPKQVVLAYEVE